MSEHEIEIPEQFQAKIKMLHLSTQMGLKDKQGKVFGKINGKVKIDNGYDFEDAEGKMIAVAHMKRQGDKLNSMDILDHNHHKIGSLHHLLVSLGPKVIERVTLKDGSSWHLGETEQIDIVKQFVTIRDKKGHILAEVKKGVFSLLGETYQVRTQSESLDRRVLVFLPMFMYLLEHQRNNLWKGKKQGDPEQKEQEQK